MYFRKIYVLFPPYFDHDVFMHHLSIYVYQLI